MYTLPAGKWVGFAPPIAFFLQNLSVEQITSKDLTTIFSGPCHGKLRWLQLDVILLLLD